MLSQEASVVVAEAVMLTRVGEASRSLHTAGTTVYT